MLAVAAAAATVAVPGALATGPTETLATLQTALNTASPGGTVALSGSVTGATGTGLSIPSGENLTLDLAGYALSVDATGGGTAGIIVPATSGLTIEDTSSGHIGTLTATGDGSAAGIGSNYQNTAGNVTITGGTITANGGTANGGVGNGGAGIGGGDASQGDIKISGGSVTATGGYGDVGIGGLSNTAVITISGGSVTAVGASTSAGIGGENGAIPSAITISGGSVNATGGEYAAGIGSGYDNPYVGDITISGGTVRAAGGANGGAGIGDGVDSDNSGAITIAGGDVTAVGGTGAPGIGNTNNGGTNFAVTLSGGITNATGGVDAPGIGSGDSSSAGTLALTVDGAPLGSTGTDGGASTGGGTVSTITSDPGSPLFYTDASSTGIGGSATITFVYPVSFDLDGHGSTIAPQLVAYDAHVTQPTAPTADGYTFGGWYSDSGLTEAFNFSAGIEPAPPAPVTLYAKWTALATPTPTTTRPTPTTATPTPSRKIVDPTIKAHLSSASKRSHGWYRSAVRISFTCKRGSARLKSACPGPVTLSKGGSHQRLTRTIRATDGGHATVTVTSINIDRVPPKVAITGITSHATYLGLSGIPAAHCRASDNLSGVASCTVKTRRDGVTVVYLAKATDRAGNGSTTEVTIRLSLFALSGVIPSRGAYTVRRQESYTFSVLAPTQPRYVNAAPWPEQPSGPSVLFTRAGSRDGMPEWRVRVTIDTAVGSASRWNLGYLVGTTLHSATVTVKP